jgi:hypothetical protein
MTYPTPPTRSSSDIVFPSLGAAAFVVGSIWLFILLALSLTAGIASGETPSATSAAEASSVSGWLAVIGAAVLYLAGSVLSSLRIRSRAKVYAVFMLVLNAGSLLVVVLLTVGWQAITP